MPYPADLSHFPLRAAVEENARLNGPYIDALDIARRLDTVMVTEDTDFGNPVMRQRTPSAGVILLRLSGLARPLQPDCIVSTLAMRATAIPHSFTVIAPTSVRIRALP